MTCCSSFLPCGMKACSRWKGTLWPSSCHTSRPRTSSLPWNVVVLAFGRLTSDGSNPISWASIDMSFGVCALATLNSSHIHIYICCHVQQATSMSEGTFSRGWRGRRERRHLPSVFSSWARRAPLKVWTYQILWSSSNHKIQFFPRVVEWMIMLT